MDWKEIKNIIKEELKEATTVSAGNTTGLGNGSPLRNKGIYLERGDRIYVGVYAEGPNTAGYSEGAHIIAQGGFF